MAHDALSALNTAIEELETELQANPRFALLSQLRNARDAYIAASEGGVAGASSSHVALKPREPKLNLSPGRAKAYELCKKALAGHTTPVRTRDLYDMLEQNGVNLAGGMNNLSSFLSRHPQVFKGYGRAGWTLKDVGNGAEPSSGANGEGPAPLFSSSQEGGDGHEATTIN